MQKGIGPSVYSDGNKPDAGTNRLQAVAQGKDVGAEVHPKVLEEIIDPSGSHRHLKFNSGLLRFEVILEIEI